MSPEQATVHGVPHILIGILLYVDIISWACQGRQAMTGCGLSKGCLSAFPDNFGLVCYFTEHWWRSAQLI